MTLKKRIEWIDAAKGLGIFLVVLGHALPETSIVATTIWVFHMPLFFFLSGLNVKSWQPGGAHSLLRGIKGLLVPYVFFSVVSIILWLLATGEVISAESWGTQLHQMAYGVAGVEGGLRYNVPLWFFTCLLSVRLLFALITAVFKSTLSRVIVALCLAMLAHVSLYPYFYSLVWNLDVAFAALLFFGAGYLLQDARVPSSFDPRTLRQVICAGSVVVVAAAVLINGRVDMNGRGFGNPLVFYLAAFAGIALMVELSKRCAGIGILRTVGYATIVIFPLHILFGLLPYRIMPIATWYAFRLTHSDVLAAVVVALIEIALCLPVYFAIMRWSPEVIGQSRVRGPSAYVSA